jgi:hypothetical protein
MKPSTRTTKLFQHLFGIATLMGAVPVSQAMTIHHSAYVSPNIAVTVTNQGTVGAGFSDSISRTLTQSVQQFNIAGAVLLSAGVGFTFDVTSQGTLSRTPGVIDLAAGGSQNVLDLLSGDNDIATCPTKTIGETCPSAALVHNYFFGIAASDWNIILGNGTFDVSDAGLAVFNGGCFAGASANGTCANDAFWSHEAIFDLKFARLEFNYCLPGEGGGCPDAAVGVNSPDMQQTGNGGTIGLNRVPEPGSLALIGAGLAGLAVMRRRKFV